MRKWQTEFPDFKPNDMPTIPFGFDDTSWHNDVCPSFTSDAVGLIIWIDYLDPDLREHGNKRRRFALQSQDHGIETSDYWLDTDDWQEILNAVEARRTERQARCQHRDDGRGRCINCGKFL